MSTIFKQLGNLKNFSKDETVTLYFLYQDEFSKTVDYLSTFRGPVKAKVLVDQPDYTNSKIHKIYLDVDRPEVDAGGRLPREVELEILQSIIKFLKDSGFKRVNVLPSARYPELKKEKVDAQNKEFAKKAQTILKDLGHDVSLGHTYELLSRLAGHNDHNTAKAKGVQFAPTVQRVSVKTIHVDSTGREGESVFAVKVKMYPTTRDDSMEFVKWYKISAKTKALAQKYVQAYLMWRRDGEMDSSVEARVDDIAAVESEDSFLNNNWQLVYGTAQRMEVADVYLEKE